MFGKMYIASVEKTREGDIVTLSPVPVPAKARSGEEPPPSTQMPEGERPPVYGGGTGSLGGHDDRPTSPDEHLRLTGDLRFFAPPSVTAKSGQVYLLSITPSQGETIDVEVEGKTVQKNQNKKGNNERHER